MATNPPLRAPLQKPTSYDIAQEQMRHNDALNWFGEMTCFLAWWHIDDFNEGLVQRCSTCTAGVDAEIFDAYKQPHRAHCPNCYGTTFEGGLKAVYFKAAIWDLTPVSEEEVTKRGAVERVRGLIEYPSDLVLRQADHVVRQDGTRWQIAQPTWQEITTGFGSQRGQLGHRMQGKVQINKEDETTPVFDVEVDFEGQTVVGWVPYVPYSPSPSDQVNT